VKKHKMAFGVIMLALIGFIADSAYAQMQQQNPIQEPGPNGECAQPVGTEPVCRTPTCPDGGCFPDIQEGECWSQCISPAQFKTVYNKLEVGSSCPTPRVTQDGTETVSVDKTIREKCYGLRRPVRCEEKQVGWTYELVKPETTKTITYITCQEQQVSPAYASNTKAMKVAYEEPVGRPGTEKAKKIKVKVKSEWDHLYRKKSTCWDCADVCRKTEEPEYAWITGYTCPSACQECSFDYKKKYTTCSYDVEQCIEPDLPSPDLACETRSVEVVTPPEYRKKPVVVEVCSHTKVKRFSVPGLIEPVDCSVPKFSESCESGSAQTKCVAQQVQACEPFLEWRKEQFCNYDDQGDFIRLVQQALIQEGFDPGPVDGLMGNETRQAIRDFQQRKGLAQGGTLTQETVQALGVER
jgi:hypothetical protein